MKKVIIKVITGIGISFVIFLGLSFSLYKLANARGFQLMGTIVRSVDTDEKVVALTFDDGPTEKTDEILKVLDEAGIKATFFLNGKPMQEYPERAQSIAAAGHEIGNHTYSHKRMVFKSPAFIKQEIEETDRLIRETGYLGDIHFRPPNGKKLLLLPYYLKQNNKKTIMWDIEPDSYGEIAGDADKIIEHVKGNVKPGFIILLHIMYDNEERQSLEAIPGIVKSLSEQGYTFKTVSELLSYQEGSVK